MSDGLYEEKVKSEGELLLRLREIPVGLIVLHRGQPLRPMSHHQLLIKLVQDRPDLFRLVATYPVDNQGKHGTGSIDAYELIGWQDLPRGEIRLDTTLTLGRELISKPHP
jgi:hypothetical protein